MKVKDIKIENGELVVLAEARISLSKCSNDFVTDIIDIKDEIINGKPCEDSTIIDTEFNVKDDGSFLFTKIRKPV